MMLPAQEIFTANLTAVEQLNEVLKNTLTGINQYFLHARMLKHKGFMKLADFEYKQSLDTMKYTDQLVNLVLTLGGLPNLQDLGKLRIGETVPQMLKNDLALAEDALAAILAANTEGVQPVLSAMFAAGKQHTKFLQNELNQIDSIGINAYLQTQI